MATAATISTPNPGKAPARAAAGANAEGPLLFHEAVLELLALQRHPGLLRQLGEACLGQVVGETLLVEVVPADLHVPRLLTTALLVGVAADLVDAPA